MNRTWCVKLIIVMLSFTFANNANSAVSVDGNVEGYAEGYTNGYYVNFKLDDGSVRAGGELYFHTTGNMLHVGFTAPYTGANAINDNTWGDHRSAGWGGDTHLFEKLQKSDKWKWKDPKLSTGSGTGVIELEFDYLADDDSKVALVKKAKQDGVEKKGAFTLASSLQLNLANNATAYQNDSFDFSTATDWLYGISYEWSVDNSKIDGSLTEATILANFGEFHMSPIMGGAKVKDTEIKDPIPVAEPATLGLFGLGLAGLGLAARRRRAG